ncbi:MAG TPA: Mrp/NBP35 family ATP-binding protein [Acidimicrobiales bacterium]|nr:Mrp/NBP35 family ATP-binding protein [Acidimicrobiales bacterium]
MPAEAPSPPTDEVVMAALRGVIDPELGDNVVDLGMVRGVEVGANGEVEVDLALTIAGCPLRTQLQGDVEGRVGGLPGVASVRVRMAEMTADERSRVMARARWKAREQPTETEIPPSARVVAVASGKGGVGKSSVTVNLAAALAARGLTVGLLDADIWGFSVPRMLGIEGRMEAEGTSEEWSMIPITKPVGSGRLKVVSMGFLAQVEDEAIMWRGLLLNRALQHFIENVRWGELDYLLVDMPPGTGDIQMGLARMLPRTELIIVTTPALAAAKVATRAADMARKGYLRVAGVIENMTAFVCEHGSSYPLFGSGGGQRVAEDIGAPLIGAVPLDPAVAAGGDSGTPVAVGGQGPTAEAFDAIAARITDEILPLVEMSGCTARMLDRVEAALDG